MAVYVDHKRSNQHERASSLVGKYGHEERIERLASAMPTKKKEVTGPTFKESAEKFIAEYDVVTQGQRNEEWAKNHTMRANVHLLPYFKDKSISDINAGIFQEYRMHRMTGIKVKSQAAVPCIMKP